jgi:5-(carboxyamino)imidazole ribonucleotide mutase
MGSKSDLEHCIKIKNTLDTFKVDCVLRVASAHKTPLKVLEILEATSEQDVVFVTVAGRSNALSGFVDANTAHPVIACPPYSDSFAGSDIFSSLRMPSGVCPLLIMDPELAALAAVKILSLADKRLRDTIADFQDKKRKEIDNDDVRILASRQADIDTACQ